MNTTLLEALRIAEAALADIGDADREPGDDLAWCERRAAQALPAVRAALAAGEGRPVADIVIEPDYWDRGHFYQGHRKIVRTLIDIEHLPVGTKLHV